MLAWNLRIKYQTSSVSISILTVLSYKRFEKWHIGTARRKFVWWLLWKALEVFGQGSTANATEKQMLLERQIPQSEPTWRMDDKHCNSPRLGKDRHRRRRGTRDDWRKLRRYLRCLCEHRRTWLRQIYTYEGKGIHGDASWDSIDDHPEPDDELILIITL